MGDKVFYITTPIYYPSEKLHIGHALTTTMADTLARYKRLKGYDVFFLTGSDEHGQKIERRAQEAGLETLKYVDRIVDSFQELWQRLSISYNDFIRTTEKRHMETVQNLLQKIYEQGDIYKSTYEGWYCTPCETFFNDRQLVEGNCPDCGRPVEMLREESYFFRMSKYADRLRQHIIDNPDFIQPASRRNEMLSFIAGGLEDLCISRTTFDWGIPLPMDDKHVVYVWFDAIANYISALGYGSTDDSLFRKYWSGAVHLVGKDIVRFHTIIWPIILMAAGIELPRQVYGHGWLLLEGDKMSKSKGKVVDPMVLIDHYGADAVRYFLLREMPYGSDGYYSEKALVNRINIDLANDFGNLLSRTTAMIEKFNQGILAAPAAAVTSEPLDEDLKETAQTVRGELDKALDNFEFARALGFIWRLVNRANKYIEETAPWALAKETAKKRRLCTVLYNLAEAIRQATIMVSPFMPGVPARVWRQLGLTHVPEVQTWDSLSAWGAIPDGIKIRRGEPIFPRIDISKLEGETVVTVKKDSVAVAPQTEDKPQQEEITIDEFARIKLRVAQVLAAEEMPRADKLLKLEVKVGNEQRTIVAGIAQYYQPQELVGKKVIIVANLKPAKLRGVISQGMLLAAVDGDSLTLVTPERPIGDGAQVE